MTTALLLALALAAPSARASGSEGVRLAAERSFLSAAPFAPSASCSDLDFGGASWPGSMDRDDQAALQVALNISGSFEGADGWANLSDDFDGQGVSLGLLNQNLGQGSLQPLLIRLRDESPAVLARLTPAHRRGLLAMLARWESAAAVESVPGPLSILDRPDEVGGPRTASANAASAAWAVANLYSGGRFDPVWKSELTALASSPEYVSLQIAAAAVNHDRAAADEARLGLRELRAYLMLYDIQVQNGGLYAQDLADYDAYFRSRRSAGVTARLEKILELRLRHVRSRYRTDVLLRKRAILRGKGTVHGSPRDLPAQYCYDPLKPYR